MDTHRTVPKPTRRRIWDLLWKCDSRTREDTDHCDFMVHQFLDAVQQEESRLRELRHATTQPTLFRAPLLDSLVRYCDSVQKHLKKARTLVDEANACLQPARLFFLKDPSPSRPDAKKKLVAMIEQVRSVNKKEAAGQATALLNLADPHRSVTSESIRQLLYDETRSRPPSQTRPTDRTTR